MDGSRINSPFSWTVDCLKAAEEKALTLIAEMLENKSIF